MAGGSLNREIYDYFKCKSIIPTASAFVQARAKILPEAFQFLFTEFNREYTYNKKYKVFQTWDFESKCTINLRVVRFKITEDTYETIVTSLNRFEFGIAEIKHLYHLRWSIETSFRELKYALGLVNLHSKRKDFIIQEIWARLTMYNFAERIIQAVVIKQDNNRKWEY